MNEPFEKGKKQVNSYLKYSGMGFQIAGSIALGAFIGYQLDKWQQTKQPYFTLAFSVVFLVAGMYLAFKDLAKPKK